MEKDLFRLLIVDDEDSVVDSLAETIDWKSIGICEVLKAYSGNEAMEILKTNPVDVVITDIRMPGISGLELIAFIRKNWKKIKCILLSGYAEFAYAQKAIAQHTFDYLLKPVSDEDLLKTVHNAVRELQEERDKNQNFQRALQAFQEHLPLLRGEFLNGLLQGMKYTPKQLSEKMRSLQLHVDEDDALALLVVRMEGALAELDFYQASLMEYSIVNMAEELAEGRFQLWNGKDIHGYLVFAVTWSPKKHAEATLEEATAQLQMVASQLVMNVNRYLKGTVSVIISQWGRFPQDVRRLYDEALLALRRQIGHQTGLIIYTSEEVENVPVQSLQTLYEPPLLAHLLEAGNWAGAEEKLAAVCQELQQRWANSAEHLTEAYFYIYAAYSAFAHKHERSLADLIGPELSETAGVMPHRSAASLEDWVLQSFRALKARIESEPGDERKVMVQKIKAFVQEHLVEDVSLQRIADHLRIHPVHVSRLFKLETGENLSDYVLRLKMEKAVKLLEDPHLKNYEIALRLGYQNPNYFIKVFKKYYSMTPQEYRNANKVESG